MCKGCVASELTISILRMELARESERADKFEKLALSLGGIINETLDSGPIEQEAIKGKTTWAELRRRLEAADRKKFNELRNTTTEPEGQEG